MSSGAKVFCITKYDRSLGLTLERIPNKESNQKQAVERVFVSHCEKDSLCPGTEKHEITHVGGLATNRGFHACLAQVRKCKTARKPYSIIFQHLSNEYQEEILNEQKEISAVISNILDRAVPQGLIQRFLQDEPIVQPPKRPKEDWMPRIKLKLGKRHRQLQEIRQATQTQLPTF